MSDDTIKQLVKEEPEQLTIEEVFRIVGAKEVENISLRKQIVKLNQLLQLKELKLQANKPIENISVLKK